jgi:hypothetical protein
MKAIELYIPKTTAQSNRLVASGFSYRQPAMEATSVVNSDAQQNNQDVEQDFYSTLLTNPLTIYCGFARCCLFFAVAIGTYTADRAVEQNSAVQNCR